jgi:hypothetical protein
MGEYSGPAEITGPDGEAHLVGANLQSWTAEASGLLSWGGTLAGSVHWLEMEGVTLSLRIDDRASDCYLTHVEVLNPRAAVTIVGEGPPPFD